MKIKELENLLLETFSKEQADKIFTEIPMEIKKLVYAKFSIGKDGLDIRGKTLLNLYKKYPVEKKIVIHSMIIIANATKEELKTITNWESIKEIEKKRKKFKAPELKSFSDLKAKDFGEEILVFPNTYEQIRDASNWMAGRDTSGEERADVNHWCVSASSPESYENYRKKMDARFVIIIKKKENGKPNWNKRYLYSEYFLKPHVEADEYEKIREFADKFNEHINSKNIREMFSKKTVDFLSDFYNKIKVSKPKVKYSEFSGAPYIETDVKEKGFNKLKGNE